MKQHLPYYMAYPMPFLYDDDKMDRRDYEYLKSMYPLTIKRILPHVEEECDRMSYVGSVIYDEYPDQLQIHMMCRRICDKVKEEGELDEATRNLVQILLFQELYQRRCQYRKDRKKFYL